MFAAAVARTMMLNRTRSVAARFGRHGMPPPASNPDLCPFDLETGMRVASKVWKVPSKFRHAGPLRSRIIRYVGDGRTDRRTDGRTDKSNAYCLLPSASPVMSRLTSSFTCQLISIIITTLIIHHSFTFSLQAQNLTFQQILPTLDFFYLPDCLHDNGTGPDLSCSSFYF